MNGRSADFTTAEVEAIRGTGEVLERYADATSVAPRADLAASIMAAIESEALPAPLTAMGTAVRVRSRTGILAAMRDTWRVAWSGGRPLAIRATAAFAVLLVVGGGVSAGGLAAGAAWGALHAEAPSPAPTALPVVMPPVAPSATAQPPAVGSPVPAPTASGPGPSPTPPTPTPTPRPTHRATPAATHRATPRPTQRPRPTPEWTHHPDPSHGWGGGDW